MKYCIDIGDFGRNVWTSFCGKITDVSARELFVVLHTSILDVREYIYHNEDWEWCEDCANDSRLTLKVLDNLKI